MGREVRMVPADWQHPKNERGSYIPLYDGSYAEAAAEWDAGYQKWQTSPEDDCTYTEWAGARPSPDDYMPDWPADQRTHYMMYEDTSEGTPISPAFATPEELARWLADTGASAFGGQTASYEAWLRVAKAGGYAPSAVLIGGQIISGVEALKDAD